MTKILIDCSGDIDLKKIEEQIEKALHKKTICKFQYLEEAERRIEGGEVSTYRGAAEAIAAETGEKPETIERRIHRAKATDKKKVVSQPPPVGKFIFSCSKQIYQIRTKLAEVVPVLDQINGATIEPLITSLVEFIITVRPILEKSKIEGVDHEAVAHSRERLLG
jgi:hypothetical protein